MGAKKVVMAVVIICLITPVMAFAGAAQNSKGPEGGYKAALLADQGTLLEKMVAEQHETNVLLKVAQAGKAHQLALCAV